MVLADAYPNYSICGIPYHVSGEVPDWRNLAHRTIADLEQTGMRLHLDTLAETIDVAGHTLTLRNGDGEQRLAYDKLIIGTGAVSVRPPIAGLETDVDGVYLLHTIGDTLRIMEFLERRPLVRCASMRSGFSSRSRMRSSHPGTSSTRRATHGTELKASPHQSSARTRKRHFPGTARARSMTSSGTRARSYIPRHISGCSRAASVNSA